MPIEFKRAIPMIRIFDVEKAKEFYIAFLGFSLDWEHRPADAPAYLQVSRGTLALHLTEYPGDCCPGSNVFVDMTGIEEFHSEVSAKPYKYMHPALETAPWNARTMDVIDPFGNRLRFNEFLALNK